MKFFESMLIQRIVYILILKKWIRSFKVKLASTFNKKEEVTLKEKVNSLKNKRIL